MAMENVMNMGSASEDDSSMPSISSDELVANHEQHAHRVEPGPWPKWEHAYLTRGQPLHAASMPHAVNWLRTYQHLLPKLDMREPVIKHFLNYRLIAEFTMGNKVYLRYQVMDPFGVEYRNKDLIFRQLTTIVIHILPSVTNDEGTLTVYEVQYGATGGFLTAMFCPSQEVVRFGAFVKRLRKKMALRGDFSKHQMYRLTFALGHAAVLL